MYYKLIIGCLIGISSSSFSQAHDNLARKYGFAPCSKVTEEKLKELNFQCKNKSSDYDFFSCAYFSKNKHVSLLAFGDLDDQRVAEMHFTKIDPNVNYGYGLVGSRFTYENALKIMKAARIYPDGKKTNAGYRLITGTVQWCESIENYYIINFNKQGKPVSLKIKSNLP